MFLTIKQEEQENREVITDLFGNIAMDNVRSIISKLDSEKKQEMISKIDNHIVFYVKISKEEPKGNNLRVLTAKLRVDTIYHQLLELLKS